MSWFSDLFRRTPVVVAPSRPVFVCQVRTNGPSMYPTFGVNETVDLELCAFGDLRGNDTVIYWHSETRQWVHHRLQYRDDSGQWVTRGDNNGGNDRGHVTADEFVGRTHKMTGTPIASDVDDFAVFRVKYLPSI